MTTRHETDNGEHTNVSTRLTLTLLLGLLLAGCAAQVHMEPEPTASGDWLQTVMDYRARAAEHPRDAAVRMAREKAELAAAEFYLEEGNERMAAGNVEKAIVSYRNGLVARPDDPQLRRALSGAMGAREARHAYDQALSLIEMNRLSEATSRLEEALDLNPDFSQARQKLEEVAAKKDLYERYRSQLSSRERITLNFNGTDIRDAFQYVAEANDLNIVFDNEVKSVPVTLFAENVTLRQALDLIFRSTDTQYKQIGANTLLIAPDTPEKRSQYQDRLLRTFSLNSIKAAEMAEILKSGLRLESVVINERMNTLSIREPDDVIALAEKLIIANDQPMGEVILDVEVLELDRTKSEQLGLNLGEQITLAYPQFETGDSIRDDVLTKGVVTVPTITFNYLKRDVGATMLASPSLRVLDNQQAKLHIGERVPLRSSTILDATGQTRTTFEYRDVGIKLEVMPDIHLDGSVAASIGIEVSALGANLGTPDEPAISILTRRVETGMLLRDGETAVIGGLIQDMDSNNRVRPVGLGELGTIGKLFSNTTDEKRRTDVMLTITPRVVRPAAMPPQAVRSFYSGNAERFTSEPMFDYIGSKANVRMHGKSAEPGPMAPAVAAAEDLAEKTAGNGAPGLAFTEDSYQTTSGKTLTVSVRAGDLGAIEELPLDVLFNPELVSFKGVRPVGGGTLTAAAETGDKAGMVTIRLSGRPSGASGSLIDIELEARKAGISYLMARPAMLATPEGEAQPVDGFNSRVVVR